MKKLLYILISTGNLLLLSLETDREYTKNTCHRTYHSNVPLSTDKEREACEECTYSRFEVYDTKIHIAHIAYNPHLCIIEYLRVDEEFKKQGIGTELVRRALEDLIKNHGCNKVSLYSSENAPRFWRKLGANPDPDGNDLKLFFSAQSLSLS